MKMNPENDKVRNTGHV